MTSERIKEIQKQTAYPESVSVMLALQKVWNECEQEYLQYGNTTLTRQPMNPIKKWLRKREIRREMEKLENKHKDLWFNSNITVTEFIIIRDSMLLRIKEFERELNELD